MILISVLINQGCGAAQKIAILRISLINPTVVPLVYFSLN
jgi:hypothetical protein